jgi:hypothetical protein
VVVVVVEIVASVALLALVAQAEAVLVALVRQSVERLEPRIPVVVVEAMAEHSQTTQRRVLAVQVS